MFGGKFYLIIFKRISGGNKWKFNLPPICDIDKKDLLKEKYIFLVRQVNCFKIVATLIYNVSASIKKILVIPVFPKKIRTYPQSSCIFWVFIKYQICSHTSQSAQIITGLFEIPSCLRHFKIVCLGPKRFPIEILTITIKRTKTTPNDNKKTKLLNYLYQPWHSFMNIL